MAVSKSQLLAARSVRDTAVAIAIALLSASGAMPIHAQVPAHVDLEGSWASSDTENILERGTGPVAGDWAGIPLDESGRARALSYFTGMLSEPERICKLYNQWELADGPWDLRIWPQVNPANREIVAWWVSGSEVRAPMVIWMDGRAHPSKFAPHDRGGFTTGSWVGDMLTAYTTHMKSSQTRRNGFFNSDEATMTSTFILHGDLLTVAYVMEDPVYLTEPYVYSRSYARSDFPVASPRSVGTTWDPCVVGYEGIDEGDVPFYLPGKSTVVDQMMKIYNIPEEASLGGAETMYPEFRDKIKAKFVRPKKKCTVYCGGETFSPRADLPFPE